MNGALSAASPAELVAMAIAVLCLSIALVARVLLDRGRDRWRCRRCARELPSFDHEAGEGLVCHCCLYGCPSCGPARRSRAADS
jgi:hypothetical protein